MVKLFHDLGIFTEQRHSAQAASNCKMYSAEKYADIVTKQCFSIAKTSYNILLQCVALFCKGKTQHTKTGIILHQMTINHQMHAYVCMYECIYKTSAFEVHFCLTKQLAFSLKLRTTCDSVV